jgi:small subunit ribosomal protein S17
MAKAAENSPKPAKAAAPKAAKVAAPKAEPKAPKAPKTAVATAPVERNFRKTREGLVVSNKMQLTVVVKIERRVQHPLYGKVVLRTTKFKAHDILGCDEGDRVEIMETKPMSKDKRWRVTKILEKVK